MLMRSFSFNNDELTDKELSLFEYLIEHPEYKCDVTYEILMNALEGRIDYTRDFNLKAYESKIKSNNLIGVYNKAKIEKSYDAQISDDSNISLSDLIKDDNDMIEKLLEDSFYQEAIEYVLNSNILQISKNLFIDLKRTFLMALKGIPDAVRYLKLACDTDSKLKDYVEAILIHGVDEETKKLLEGGYCYGTG